MSSNAIFSAISASVINWDNSVQQWNLTEPNNLQLTSIDLVGFDNEYAAIYAASPVFAYEVDNYSGLITVSAPAASAMPAQGGFIQPWGRFGSCEVRSRHGRWRSHPPKACYCRWAPDTETKIPTEPAPEGVLIGPGDEVLDEPGSPG